MGLIGEIASRAEVGAHPVCRSGVSDALYNDIAALPDTKGYNVGGVRLDGHKVVGDDCHIVTVNGKALDTFGTAVDEP